MSSPALPGVPRSGGRRRRQLLLGGGICLALVLLFRFGPMGGGSFTASNEGHKPSPAVPVRVEEAARGDFDVYYASLGTVTPLNTVTVTSRVDGQLQSLHFSEGQMVEAGDLLAQIDPRPYQAQLDQAKGQLGRDQALLRNARQNLTRSKILIKQDSTTAQEVDNNQSLVGQYEGAVITDKAQMDAAALQIEYSRITAPIGGRVGLRGLDVGNMVHASAATGLVDITQVRPITVIFTVTDTQLPAIRAAMHENSALRVEAWDRTRKQLLAVGKVVSLDNRIDTSTGTVRLRAEFANLDDSLFPNQFVNARVLAATEKGVCIIPTTAVLLGSQGPYVYAVQSKDGRDAARMRRVTLGPGDDTRTVVAEGLSPGERVVVEGLDQLGDGTPVEVQSSGTPAAKALPAGGVPGA